MADTFGTVTALVRSLVNDELGSVYSDTVQVNFVNSAYRALQRKLAENGVRTMQDTAPVALTTGQTVISAASTPPLPTDFLQPYKLREKATGSADKYVDMFLCPDALPDRDQGQLNILWEWRANQIRLIGATQPVTTFIEYEKILPALTSPTDPLLVNGAVDLLAYQVAATITRSRGASEASHDFAAAGAEEMRAYLNRMTRGAQFRPVRRRPYSRSGSSLP